MARLYTAVDLSRLPAPEVVEELDHQEILSKMLTDLRSRDSSLDGLLPSDPAYKVLEVAAYREMLVRQRVNEAARAVMLAYAINGDLDQLGALFGVERLVIAPGDPDAVPPIPPTMEDNEPFRSRIQMSLAGLSTAGPEIAYIYHALSADGQVLDASVDAPRFSLATVDPALQEQLPPRSIVLQVDYDAGLETPQPGTVVVNVLSRAGDGTADPSLLDKVAGAVSADSVRPMTDQVLVRSAEIVPYQVVATLDIYPGPGGDVVLAEAQAKAAAYVEEMHRLGLDVNRSALFAALHVEGVQRVELTEPSADIVLSRNQASYCTGISLTLGDTNE